MKRGIVTAILCLVSAAGGAAGGYFYAKKKVTDSAEKKYREIADEEVASVKEALRNWYEKNWEEKKNLANDSRNKPADILTKYNTVPDEVSEEDSDDSSEAYEALMEDTPIAMPDTVFDVVSDEEFAINAEGYEVKDLVYYGGTNLREESTDELVDFEESIGRDSINHIGEYKPSMLFVRNNAQRVYYEVYVDDSDYLRIKNEGKKPRDSYFY